MPRGELENTIAVVVEVYKAFGLAVSGKVTERMATPIRGARVEEIQIKPPDKRNVQTNKTPYLGGCITKVPDVSAQHQQVRPASSLLLLQGMRNHVTTNRKWGCDSRYACSRLK